MNKEEILELIYKGEYNAPIGMPGKVWEGISVPRPNSCFTDDYEITKRDNKYYVIINWLTKIEVDKDTYDKIYNHMHDLYIKYRNDKSQNQKFTLISIFEK